jgi:hypothetical protein
MGVVALAREPQGINERLLDLLDRIDYRLAVTDEDREAIFKLRYEAYTRESGLSPRFDRRLSDRYDDVDNTSVFGMYIDGVLATTIRVTVVSAGTPDCPALEVYQDLLEPFLKEGKILIDPTRHANSEAAMKAYPGLLPYLTIRMPWMVAEYYKANGILAGVRAEHRAFYRRTFGSRQLGEARQYPTLLKPHYLTYCEFRQVRESVEKRFPSFRSTAFERRMLVEGQAMSVAAPRLGAGMPLPAASAAMA